MLTARLRRAAALAWGPPTALVVPFPELAVDAATAPGLPPHITVLYPFVAARRTGAGLRASLEETFGPFPAFDFTLTDVGRFPGVLYLAPEPAEPFVALTEACARRWPAHPPYGGAFPEVIPHLTLVEGPEPPGVAQEVQQRLPLRARAEAVWLMAPGRDGRWGRRASVALSGSSASPT